MASSVRDEVQKRCTGLVEPERGVDAAEDGFAFAAGVCGVDDLGDAGVVEEAEDDAELIFSAGLGDEEKGLREHGQGFAAPGFAPCGVHLMGFGEADEVADGPGDEIGAAAEEEALLLVGAAEGLG